MQVFHLASLIGVRYSQGCMWPLELGFNTPTLWCGPWDWGKGLPPSDLEVNINGDADKGEKEDKEEDKKQTQEDTKDKEDNTEGEHNHLEPKTRVATQYR